MAHTKQIETTLLTEHFGWTPISFIDEVINTINDLLNRLVDTIEEGLKSADPGSALGFSAKAAAEGRIIDTDEEGKEILGDEVRREIEEGVHKLETLLESTVDKNFDKWEIYVLRNCLTLGREAEELMGWIRLKGYEDLTLPSGTTTKDAPPPVTPESLMTLRRKLQATQTLHNLLLSEKQRNAAILAQLRSLISLPPTKPESHATPATKPPTTITAAGSDAPAPPSFSFLTSAPSPLATSGALPTSTAFSLTQLPHLRRLLAQLQPAVAQGGLRRTTPAPTPSAADAHARERKDYVESQTRRLLERRGLDPGEGLGMDVGGRRVGEEELKALERVVTIMGKGAEAEGERMEE